MGRNCGFWIENRVGYIIFLPEHFRKGIAMQNHAFAWFHATILGDSVNFVHKKHLAERYQWTVTGSKKLHVFNI